MKRKGLYKPTVEDAVEISGIEILHPGGFELTMRTAEVADLKKGMKVLDVSSGRGTMAIYYAKNYGVEVTGIDINTDMVNTSIQNAANEGLSHKVKFVKGDSQSLPFKDNTFDAVINECAVGIPDDSQKVLDEMTRVLKPDGKLVIHESTWKDIWEKNEKEEFAERYGTTPMEFDEWKKMLKTAGIKNIEHELEKWSSPDRFWNIRKERTVKHRFFVMTIPERIKTLFRIIKKYGFKGIGTALKNERTVTKAVLNNRLGYCLFSGTKK